MISDCLRFGWCGISNWTILVLILFMVSPETFHSNCILFTDDLVYIYLTVIVNEMRNELQLGVNIHKTGLGTELYFYNVSYFCYILFHNIEVDLYQSLGGHSTRLLFSSVPRVDK